MEIYRPTRLTVTFATQFSKLGFVLHTGTGQTGNSNLMYVS